MDFSVIIPDTDSQRMSEILCALRGQSAYLTAGEILVVGSDRPGLVREDELVRFIPTDFENRFASDKRNLGMQGAKGEIFLFMDDDCIPQPDWIERHLARHAGGERIVGGAVELGNRNYLQLADNISAFHFMTPYAEAGYRSYLCTTNLSVHRSVVEKVGEMEAHKNRADDLEWTARFRLSGYQLYFDPEAIVYHDPQRCSFEAVWRHWWEDAPDTLRVRLMYADLLGTPRLAGKRGMFMWASPLVAAWATAKAFSNRRNLRAYGHTIPLVYLTKLVWCWSAFCNFPEWRATA
jgi:cellulose synthase/poly-beta-1,6-N-acetylglucosamine synthase-like glycosyltransferase